MDDEQVERRFAEQMALLFETGGLPAMAGRVWAALLVTEGPHLSARELGDRLGVSAGSVSTANRFLLRLGLIERVWVPGERRDYYAARPGAIADLVRLRLDRLVATEQLAAEALEQFGERPHARSRLTEIHDVYSWYARELPALHERFLAERALPREREHQ